MSRVVSSLKEYPEFNPGNPKLNSGRRSHSGMNITTEKTNKERAFRMISSVTSDFIHNVSNGQIITPKHYLFALGLHNLTGQRQPVVMTNKLGHCMSYDVCCEIETALSEAAVAKSKETNILQIRPEGAETVQTVFWVDNFDVNVEKAGAGGAVSTTHLVAFQEQAPWH